MLRWIRSKLGLSEALRARREANPCAPTFDATPRIRWDAAHSDEVAFWSRWLDDRDAPGLRFRLDASTELQPFVLRWLDGGSGVGSQTRPVRILDVGCGPISNLGRRLPLSRGGEGERAARAIEIVGVDPLADRYRELLAARGIAPWHALVACEGERLDERFADGDFDLVFSNNALDHAHDPLACLVQMVRAVRRGGCVVVQIGEREGARAGYSGLHQWDFALDGGNRLTLASPGARPVDIARALSGIAELEALERVFENPAGLPWNHPHVRAVFRRIDDAASLGRSEREARAR
jgi:SAM-dependent methyltransferase